jgi:hypothetical protein
MRLPHLLVIISLTSVPSQLFPISDVKSTNPSMGLGSNYISGRRNFDFVVPLCNPEPKVQRSRRYAKYYRSVQYTEAGGEKLVLSQTVKMPMYRPTV